MVGIDIVDISRFEKMKDINLFLKKYYTKNEIEYINTKLNKFETIAGIYSCKEAFLKAIGEGIGRTFKLNEIEVLHDNLGKPYINKTLKINDYLLNNKLASINVSISHTNSIAESIVLLN